MNRTRHGAALVTGSSSGIGRATALALHTAGFVVYATARRAEDLADLGSAGLRARQLDVTDARSCIDVVREIEREHGQVSLLVNNAGYALYAPVETADLDAVVAQLETNVVAAVRLVQLVLPAMRAARQGRIVMVGSMGGQVTFPSGAFYHASKHALEAVTDALRLEVTPFGIRVVLVQPGPVRTGFLANADQATPSDEAAGGPYDSFMAEVERANASAYADGRFASLALSPEAVARVIVRAAVAAHPRPRYAVGVLARALMTTRRVLPDQAWDAFLRMQYPTPRP